MTGHENKVVANEDLHVVGAPCGRAGYPPIGTWQKEEYNGQIWWTCVSNK